MSSMAALVFLAASAPPAAGISAEQAMANYQALTRATPDATPRSGCPTGDESGIVVCGQRKQPPPRLPLPDERGEPGEAIHHPGEPRSALAPPARRVRPIG
jgi:hypothetical protein